MNTETDYLKRIAEEIAANTDNKYSIPDHHLVTETNRLENAIIHSLYQIENDTQRDTFHFNTLRKLVNICDILFDRTSAIDANVQVLLDLLTNVKAILPTEIRPNTKLPNAFVMTQESKFREAWTSHEQEMRNQEIDEELIELAGVPFKKFKLDKHRLYWGDFTWLKAYQAKLDIIDWDHADCNSKSEALTSLLIGRDFNDDRFYVYCKKYIEARVRTIKGKRDRVMELAQCENLVREDTQAGNASFDTHADSVSARLIKLIREKIDSIEMHEREHPYVKLAFKWSAEMIACFFKLLHDRGVFGKITLEPFSEVIATNCSSINKGDFQASTIYSRFYKKDIELLKLLEKLLLELLDDIRKFLR